MSRLLLILGGTRSGKSRYAENRILAAAGDEVTYVATMQRGAPDVEARIAAHQRRRPAAWQTVEVPADGRVGAALAVRPARRGVLLDGFELALASAAPPSDEEAISLARADALACHNAARQLACIVSAEVGMGVVPASIEGVDFRDRVGAANQALAEVADEVVLIVAGLPLWLRGAAR